jgi:hypothetical protein
MTDKGNAEAARSEGDAAFIAKPSGGDPSAFLFPTVFADAVRAAYAKAPGNEFTSGKMASPESSSECRLRNARARMSLMRAVLVQMSFARSRQ